ncbi:MAG: DUF6602 domain-containing protein [Candidatus Cloacimonadaceae bacterium]
MGYQDHGKRIREFFNHKANVLQNQYEIIEKLLPAPRGQKGAAHKAEEGRYVESLIRSFLNSVLPKELRAFSGFILRPSTKTGKSDIGRKIRNEADEHSSQLDIIVYDVAHYPVYESFEEFAILPPEGVVAIFSVKKRLYLDDINNELIALNKAINLCRGCSGVRHNYTSETKHLIQRAPITGIIAFTLSRKSNLVSITNGINKRIAKNYSSQLYPFDMLVNQINVLDTLCVFKTRPKPDTEDVREAKYIYYNYNQQLHNGLQFLLTGILSSYYDPTRSNIYRPGYTCFEPSRKHDGEFNPINVLGLRCK